MSTHPITQSTPSKSLNRHNRLIGVFVGAWMMCLLAGVFVVTGYATNPGEQHRLLFEWPSSSYMERSRDLTTVVLFVHPRCPCTFASKREFERLLPTITESVLLKVVYFHPKNESEQWVRSTKLFQAFNQLAPGAAVMDCNGLEAQSFGVKNSGHILAFSPSGKCLYSGGVTPSRGHEGSNFGLSALRVAIEKQQRTRLDFPVFGCSIVTPESES